MPSIWYPMYQSHVAVYRQDMLIVNGVTTATWLKTNEILDKRLNVPGEMRCFLDLLFIRALKDSPPAAEQGSAIPMRTGVMFCDDTEGGLKPGDRLVCKSGPVTGVFQIKAVPDQVPNVLLGVIDHVEVQVFEIAGSQRETYPEAQAD